MIFFFYFDEIINLLLSLTHDYFDLSSDQPTFLGPTQEWNEQFIMNQNY
jgi:hypothetical protein